MKTLPWILAFKSHSRFGISVNIDATSSGRPSAQQREEVNEYLPQS